MIQLNFRAAVAVLLFCGLLTSCKQRASTAGVKDESSDTFVVSDPLILQFETQLKTVTNNFPQLLAATNDQSLEGGRELQKQLSPIVKNVAVAVDRMGLILDRIIRSDQGRRLKRNTYTNESGEEIVGLEDVQSKLGRLQTIVQEKLELNVSGVSHGDPAARTEFQLAAFQMKELGEKLLSDVASWKNAPSTTDPEPEEPEEPVVSEVDRFCSPIIDYSYSGRRACGFLHFQYGRATFRWHSYDGRGDDPERECRQEYEANSDCAAEGKAKLASFRTTIVAGVKYLLAAQGISPDPIGDVVKNVCSRFGEGWSWPSFVSERNFFEVAETLKSHLGQTHYYVDIRGETRYCEVRASERTCYYSYQRRPHGFYDPGGAIICSLRH